MRRWVVIALACALAWPAWAQSPASIPGDREIDAAARSQAIDASLAALRQSYVFPEVAERVADAVRARDRAGDYAGETSARGFAWRLTQDMQAASRDKHLRVFYTPDLADGRHGPAPGAGAAAEEEFFRSRNYGLDKAERLEGNIGYLEVSSFAAEGDAAGETVAAAMTFLANTDALIIDLRRNGGGRPQTVALLSSYLFDAPVLLNSLYWRERNRTDDFWTSATVQGRRYGKDKPVFVLTSARTFSGAEEFAYNLKNLKRATIVGETTGGGANPGGMRRLTEDFTMFVPMGRAINPITKTNWEGTGVAPDVAVASQKALEAALELARKGKAPGPQ